MIAVHLCTVGKNNFRQHKTSRMKSTKDKLDLALALDVSIENEDVIASQNGHSKTKREIVMTQSEENRKLQQNYYNKINGCSVKPQKGHLFDFEAF